MLRKVDAGPQVVSSYHGYRQIVCCAMLQHVCDALVIVCRVFSLHVMNPMGRNSYLCVDHKFIVSCYEVLCGKIQAASCV